MIIVRVMGGTGNQMFQYALARKLKEMNKYVVLDISAYKTWEFRYDFCLNRIFDINKDIYITEDPNEFIIKNCRNIKIIDCENQPYYNADILNYGLMSIFWTQKVKLFYAALLANNSH